MFASIAETATQPAGRGGEPVRRHSYRAGREGLFWRPVTRQEARRIVLAAERYELAGKQAGQRNGPLGGIALEILRLFVNVVHFRTGRLEPSYDWIMAKTKRSRPAVCRALAALRRHGFLDWLRRYVPTGNEQGPQVAQTSNAYRLSLPARAAALLGRYFQPAPISGDERHRIEQREAERDAHRRSLSLAELPLFTVEDEGLAASLSRLGAAIMTRKEREFTRETESHV